MPARRRVWPQPCQSYALVEKTVMVPTWVTEMRKVQVVECRLETRQRTVTISQQVPETQTVTDQYTIQVPESRVRTETYTVCKPVTRDVTRQYTVNVPYQETRQATRRVCKYVAVQEPVTVNVAETRMKTETYTVCKPVVKKVTQTYTVNVPYTETREGTRKVCRWVPVNETRTVCEDQGHYECVQVEAPSCGSGGCGGCAPSCCGHRGLFRRRCCYQPAPTCAPACGQPTYVTKQVWVPNVVQKQVQTTVMRQQMADEPYSYIVNLCRAEQRTRTVDVVEQVAETQTREVPYTVCVPKTQMVTVNRPQWQDETYSYVVNLCRAEVRTQVVQVQDFVREQQTREVPYTVLVPKVQTRQRQVTVYKCVPVQKTETYQLQVPVTVEKLVPTNVCRMVPKTVQCYQAVPMAPAPCGAGCAVAFRPPSLRMDATPPVAC